MQAKGGSKKGQKGNSSSMAYQHARKGLAHMDFSNPISQPDIDFGFEDVDQASIERGNGKFQQSDKSQIGVQLQRLNMIETNCETDTISAEAKKVNRLISRLEQKFSSLYRNCECSQKIKSKVGSLENKVNNLILSMSFLCSKIILEWEKLGLSLQTLTQTSAEYREALRSAETEKSSLERRLTDCYITIDNLRGQTDRLRSVSDIYHKRSKLLEIENEDQSKVIQEMNLQVEAAESKSSHYFFKYRELEYQLRAALQRINQTQEQTELVEHETHQAKKQLAQTRNELASKDSELKKWKQRCFEEQQKSFD